MSRNFELLQQAEKEAQVFRISGSVPAPAKDDKRPSRKLESAAREEEIKLVQRLFLLPGERAPRSVLVCGVEEGEGSEAISASAGEILASRVPGSVCLVDANVRVPSLHLRFRMDNFLGFTDAMFEADPIGAFAQRVSGSNLWLMPCGSRRDDLEALLSSERLRSRMKELVEEFDHVLINAPPAKLYAHAALLGKLVDGVVLVLKSSSTHREAARKVKEDFEAAGVRLMGAVLNERTFPIPESLYRKL